jgi:hypothetical protein
VTTLVAAVDGRDGALRGENCVRGLVDDVHDHPDTQVLQVVDGDRVDSVCGDLTERTALITERLTVEVLPEVVHRTFGLGLEQAQVRTDGTFRDLEANPEKDLLVGTLDLVDQVAQPCCPGWAEYPSPPSWCPTRSGTCAER